MKPDYKEKVLSNFDAMGKRIDTLVEMIDRKRPSTDKEAKNHLMELKRLLDNSSTIVDIS